MYGDLLRGSRRANNTTITHKKEKQETRIVWSATKPEDETVSDTGLPVLEIVRDKAGRGGWRPVLIEWKRSVVV